MRGAGQTPLVYLGKPEIQYSFLSELSSKLFYAVHLRGRVCLCFLSVLSYSKIKPVFYYLLLYSGVCESSDGKCI